MTKEELERLCNKEGWFLFEGEDNNCVIETEISYSEEEEDEDDDEEDEDEN